ncbi:hypothetical protein FVE85_2650 [Porphyridium purpureum]|uniref:HdeD family acid-resistance protein n=1 Tax=Porphyridium purpureum TaxID=35688 RepID=A0A5J4YSN4_PORPP|nr:hypothetical protein FVE85_2650 [Porphyridium purpureum]|eukprot:POR5322..scf227_4
MDAPPQNELSGLLGLARRGMSVMPDGVDRDPRISTLQGLSFVLYGAVALVFPALTLALFTSLFASFALLFGALSFSSLVALRPFSRAWWHTIAESVVAMGAGLLALLAPNATALFVLHIVIMWSVLIGFNQLASACLSPADRSLRLTLALNGASLVALGWFLFSNAASHGLLSLVWVIALQSIMNGAFMLLSAGLQVKFQGQMYGNAPFFAESTPDALGSGAEAA